MAFFVERVGHVVATRADRIKVARYPSANGPAAVTLIWNGSHVKHTRWDLLPDGGLFEGLLSSKHGGPNLALAEFSESRIVSMHRGGPAGELKFEAWKSLAGWELSDDALGPKDRDPEMITFGGEPGILPIPPALVKAPAATASALKQARSEGAQKEDLIVPPKLRKQITLTAKAGHAVVASITQSHQLRVSLWGFDNDGQVKVLAGKYTEIEGGPAKSASIARVKEIWAEGNVLKGAEVVTAARDAGDALRVQRWRVNLVSQGVPSSIQLLSEQTAPETVTEVTCAPVIALNGTQVATAVLLSDGNLKVIGWKMESDGGMTRWAEATGGPVSTVSATLVRGRTIATALRESDQRLKVSYWRFPATLAGALEHRGDAVEGKVGAHLRCVHLQKEGKQLGDTIVASQTEDGNLQLFRYRVAE